MVQHADIDHTGVTGVDGMPSGTSNPGSPSDGDLFYRTDLGMLIRYHSSGTRWMTVQIFHCPLSFADSLVPLTAANKAFRGVLYGATYDQYLIEWRSAVHVATTNNGSNYWTATLADQAGGAIGGGTTFNTSADSANTWLTKLVSIGAVLSGKIEVQATLNAGAGSPGNLYFASFVAYRLVIT